MRLADIKPCEICMCNWREGCDIEFSYRYSKNIRIPQGCPRGYWATNKGHLRMGNPRRGIYTRKVVFPTHIHPSRCEGVAA